MEFWLHAESMIAIVNKSEHLFFIWGKDIKRKRSVF
jgi:hypothetical protein